MGKSKERKRENFDLPRIIFGEFSKLIRLTLQYLFTICDYWHISLRSPMHRNKQVSTGKPSYVRKYRMLKTFVIDIVTNFPTYLLDDVQNKVA